MKKNVVEKLGSFFWENARLLRWINIMFYMSNTNSNGDGNQNESPQKPPYVAKPASIKVEKSGIDSPQKGNKSKEKD